MKSIFLLQLIDFKKLFNTHYVTRNNFQLIVADFATTFCVGNRSRNYILYDHKVRL